ncbi:MAG TPA: 4Fe-4S dicluster domain-containing protein [Conexivisphaerales archaeon]|nr:4Fe-4S dicluster domain-containing protein [Conexivisphaerales archaeon]
MRYVTDLDALAKLISNLRSLGYTVVGPRAEDGAVCLGEISRLEDLASGVVDVQAPGRYRLGGTSGAVFSAVNGPHSPKNFLHPACVPLTKLVKGPAALESKPIFRSDRKYAFLGLRPCDLKAVAVLDRVMMAPQYKDPVYAPLRESSFLIVVNCGRAGENCFCASMGTGPMAEGGYDLSITELGDRLVLDLPEGRMNLFEGAELKPATQKDVSDELALLAKTREEQRKRIDKEDPSDFMYEGVDSPVWEEVAQRCLSCGNCTMVCPTCFCNTVRDVTDLRDDSVTRERVWDSCLSKGFTYSAGGNPRLERKARYRQFVMHKFGYWPDQFKLYGCVGCGRCITWCPVGIDITDTVNRVLKSAGDKRPLPEVVKVA